MQEKLRLGLFAQGDSSFQVLLPPELFKPGWISGGIADGVLNVAVPEVVLNEPRIRALIGEGEAAGMAEHMRMGGQGQTGPLTIAAHGKPDRAAIERPTPFADEEVIPDRLHGGSLFQPCLDEPEFIGPQRVRGGEALLETGDMEDAAFRVHLREF